MPSSPSPTPSPAPEGVEAETRAWLLRAVIGLNLCPFAKAPQSKGLVRCVVTPASDAESLLGVLASELQHLADAPSDQVETTLLVHPQVLQDFGDYNDFLDIAEACVAELGFDGVLQVASFHPAYCFAGNAPDDVDNATNRSPYPMLHLLREDSISRAVDVFPEAETIYEANIETMRRLGAAGWAALQRQCREDAGLPADGATPGGGG